MHNKKQEKISKDTMKEIIDHHYSRFSMFPLDFDELFNAIVWAIVWTALNMAIIYYQDMLFLLPVTILLGIGFWVILIINTIHHYKSKK